MHSALHYSMSRIQFYPLKYNYFNNVGINSLCMHFLNNATIIAMHCTILFLSTSIPYQTWSIWSMAFQLCSITYLACNF